LSFEFDRDLSIVIPFSIIRSSSSIIYSCNNWGNWLDGYTMDH